MNAEIIAIGSELTSGARLDTNSQWLSLQLAELGIAVGAHATVADDLAQIVETVRAAAGRSSVVLITGGLGPTLDDLTRQALAELVARPLELHQPSLDHIQALFARRRREMPQRNVVQAMFPQGSEPIPNSRGTAPGIWLAHRAGPRAEPCRIAALPGVPSEMRRMFLEEVRPRLVGGGRVIRMHRIHCFGVGESAAEELLGDLTARGREPEVGITVHEATISLRIKAAGESADECIDNIADTAAEIRERLGDLVFGEEDDELEHVVLRLLRQGGLTLSTAESGTGGLLAQRLTGVAGFLASYAGGAVVPTDFAKQTLLGVDAGLLRQDGAVSESVARAMASACRERMQTDYALAVTECPEFDADDQASHAPVAWVALAGPELLASDEQVLAGDPAIIRSRVAKAALNMLRLHLLGRTAATGTFMTPST